MFWAIELGNIDLVEQVKSVNVLEKKLIATASVLILTPAILGQIVSSLPRSQASAMTPIEQKQWDKDNVAHNERLKEAALIELTAKAAYQSATPEQLAGLMIACDRNDVGGLDEFGIKVQNRVCEWLD